LGRRPVDAFWILYRGVKKMTLPLSWEAETVRRFLSARLGSVAVLVLTGLYQSWIQKEIEGAESEHRDEYDQFE